MKHVYAMTRSDGAVKVGISNNLAARQATISSQVGQPVSVAFHTDFRSDAKAVEDVAHRLLKSKHDTGEWFNVSLDEARSAISLAIDIVEGRAEDVTDGVRFSRNPSHMLDEGSRVHFVMSKRLMHRIDQWRGTLPDVPNRSEAIRRALEEFLSDEDRLSDQAATGESSGG